MIGLAWNLRRKLPVVALLLSPVEPLPVEFVAGGEGRPDEDEGAVGLSGGSGRSGRSGRLTLLFSLGGNDPRKIADKGRLEDEEMSGRGVITAQAANHKPQGEREKLIVLAVENSEQKVGIRRARRRGKRRVNNKASGRRATIVGIPRLYV